MAAEESNLYRFSAGFRRIALLPPKSDPRLTSAARDYSEWSTEDRRCSAAALATSISVERARNGAFTAE